MCPVQSGSAPTTRPPDHPRSRPCLSNGTASGLSTMLRVDSMEQDIGHVCLQLQIISRRRTKKAPLGQPFVVTSCSWREQMPRTKASRGVVGQPAHVKVHVKLHVKLCVNTGIDQPCVYFVHRRHEIIRHAISRFDQTAEKEANESKTDGASLCVAPLPSNWTSYADLTRSTVEQWNDPPMLLT